jgi:1-acyl-sn-glycerol-3-phosphate acyltransferase
MDISLDMVASLSPDQARRVIPEWLSTFVVVTEAANAGLLQRVDAALKAFSDEEVAHALRALVQVGDDYKLYSANPVARDVSRSFMRTLTEHCDIDGIEHLRDAMAAGPCLLLSNHLAYCDTQLKDVLLADAGAADLGDAIVAVAGPKVYGTVFRRMASVGLSTLKTAQSSSVAHNEAGLSPRAVATIALDTVRRASELMQAGRPVLLYAEGSRSRDGRIRPFIRAVRKYANVPGLRVVPVAISGSNLMMPINQAQMFPVHVSIRIGPAVERDAAGGSVPAITETWGRIAAMLPDHNKPHLDTPAIG